nr:GNAT family N-acetyltransferase [uncultured Actinomyces sp.]
MPIVSFFGHRLTPIGPHQRAGLLRVCGLEPVGAVTLAHQLCRWERWNSGDVVVLGRAGRPAAGAWATGSLLPFGLAARPGLGHDGAGSDGAHALADHARTRLTRYGSVVGPVQDVEAVWTDLAAGGLRARQERWVQPVLVAPSPDGGLAGAVVRRRPRLRWVAEALHPAGPAEEKLVLPASVAMFTDELGYDPMRAGGSYARHVSWLVATGRSYIVLDDGSGAPARPEGTGRVAFKTDVGAVWQAPTGTVAQLTGVWTRDDLRGRGIGTAALAAVVDAVRRDHTGADGIVSLYVNDFNAAALGLYGRLGFERAGTFATMLL